MYIINEPYRFDGYWAFSAEKTYWFSGVLDYSPKKKKIELRMWGTHKSAKLDFQADTVLGLTTDGEKITLLNCIVRSNSRRIHKKNSGENTYLHIIEANKVIIGKHYENSYKIAYSYIKVRYSDQFAFIQKDGFQHDLSQKNITVAYKEPGNVILGDNKDVRIEITFYGIPSSPVLSLNKFSLTQFEYFDISFSKNHDLRILSSEINFLRYLIIFSINKDISLLECSFLEKNISDNIWTAKLPDPDLIIRTGGERRLSNFLTWQSVYSELFFCDKSWPAFTKKDLDNVLEDYSKRERRFGK